MADKQVKLTATIDANSKPLQQELDKAKQAADATAKSMQGGFDAAGTAIDGAGRAARGMGEAGQSAAMTIGEAIKHPIQAVQKLVSEAVTATMQWLGLKTAAGSAGDAMAQAGNKGASGLAKTAGQAYIIAKGLQALHKIVRDLVTAWRDAYLEAERMSKLRFDLNMNVYNGQQKKWEGAKKALADYYALYQKAMAPGATAMDRERERIARQSLGYMGVEVDPNAGKPMEKQLREGIENAQKQYVKALEGKLKEAQRALDVAQQGMDEIHSHKYLYGSRGAYEAAVWRQQDLINQKHATIDQINVDLTEAKKHQNPGEDFSLRVLAEAQDALASELDKQRERLEGAQKAEEDAKKRLADAEKRRADLEKRLADDAEIEARQEAMQHMRETLDHKVGRFGFNLDEWDEENLDETNKERIQRKRNVKLDARIGAKLERLREGNKVHFTKREQARIDELRGLKQQGKELTAEQKAFEAAKKQEEAAVALEEAADEIKHAASEADAIGKTAQGIGVEIEDLEKMKKLLDDETEFFRQTATANNSAVPDYGGILDQIRELIEKQAQNVYIVK